MAAEKFWNYQHSLKKSAKKYWQRVLAMLSLPYVKGNVFHSSTELWEFNRAFGFKATNGQKESGGVFL